MPIPGSKCKSVVLYPTSVFCFTRLSQYCTDCTFSGSLLLHWLCFLFQYADRTWPVLIIGALMFIPGVYHVRIAYYAFRGYQGFSYEDIPEFDWVYQCTLLLLHLQWVIAQSLWLHIWRWLVTLPPAVHLRLIDIMFALWMGTLKSSSFIHAWVNDNCLRMWSGCMFVIQTCCSDCSQLSELTYHFQVTFLFSNFISWQIYTSFISARKASHTVYHDITIMVDSVLKIWLFHRTETGRMCG